MKGDNMKARAHHRWRPWLPSYGFALLYSILPQIYSMTTRYFLASIDSSNVQLAASYEYAGIVFEIANETVPRAAWTLFSLDAIRGRLPTKIVPRIVTYVLLHTIIITITWIILASCGNLFAEGMTGSSDDISLAYVQLAFFRSWLDSLVYMLSNLLKSLDMFLFLLISVLIRYSVNLALDMIFLSTFGVIDEPTAMTQAWCNAFVSICYLIVLSTMFIFRLRRQLTSAEGNESTISYLSRPEETTSSSSIPSSKDKIDDLPSPLATMTTSTMPEEDQNKDGITLEWRPSLHTTWQTLLFSLPLFLEVLVRNGVYLAVSHRIVEMGDDYAAAWSTFNAIRWGVIMVPIYAFTDVATTCAGTEWLRSASSSDILKRHNKATVRLLGQLSIPVFAIEAITLVLISATPLVTWFAVNLSGQEEGSVVVDYTVHLWRAMDWTYLAFIVSTLAGAVFVGAHPYWNLPSSLICNLLWQLPWAVACLDEDQCSVDPLMIIAIIFGGVNLIGAVLNSIVLLLLTYDKLPGSPGLVPNDAEPQEVIEFELTCEDNSWAARSELRLRV